MASPAENPKAVRGEASRHTCNGPSESCGLDRPKCFVPTGHHASERWPQAAHHLRSCFRTAVPQYEAGYDICTVQGLLDITTSEPQ